MGEDGDGGEWVVVSLFRCCVLGCVEGAGGARERVGGWAGTQVGPKLSMLSGAGGG